jgi:hypothetical protein
MCCCHKEITEKVTKYIIECNSSDGFWDVKLGDVANIAIALITVGLGFYVFVYQRKKDKKDQEIIIKQVRSSAKLEMFKILIIEPNVNNLHAFFQNIEQSIQALNNVSINPALINQAQTNLDTHCNSFENSFIELLDGIDHQFYLNMLNTIDTMRDGISTEIANLPAGVNGDITNIETLFFDFKSDFISRLYNFNNLEIDEL